MKRWGSFVLFALILSIGLAACGNSGEDLLGEWEASEDGESVFFLEITEDDITIRPAMERESTTVDFKVSGASDDNFIIEYSEPESGDDKFLLEGHIEDENEISIVESAGGDFAADELVRVENAEEEQEKLVKEKEEQEEKEEKERQEELARQKEEEEETVPSGEEVYMNSCASCHGDDLSGTVGPDLRNLDDKYSKEEIEDIVMNGKDSMPPMDFVEDDELELLTDWLLEENE